MAPAIGDLPKGDASSVCSCKIRRTKLQAERRRAASDIARGIEGSLAYERIVVLHYHLFKNAGTSVDSVLREYFGSRWVTKEFPTSISSNTSMVEEWILDTPDAVAFSSHTMLGPIPQIGGVRVISFLLLRDPIERIKSAYRFERQQDADTWGAELAKKHDFEGYVRARLGRSGDRQCRNFQTHRLASLVPDTLSPRQAALEAIDLLTVVGLVERFDESMARLADEVREHFPQFASKRVRANTTKADQETKPNKALDRLLREANQDDLHICQVLKNTDENP